MKCQIDFKYFFFFVWLVFVFVYFMVYYFEKFLIIYFLHGSMKPSDAKFDNVRSGDLEIIEKLSKISLKIYLSCFFLFYTNIPLKKGHNIPEIRLRALRTIKAKFSQYISLEQKDTFSKITKLIRSLIHWFSIKPLAEEDAVVELLGSVLLVII